MGSLSKPDLRNRILEAVRASGWFALEDQSDKAHPFKITVHKGGQSSEAKRLKIYIWNVTHGGNHRPADEYRIQPKVSRFEPESGYDVLILGWWEEGSVLAAFDYRKHSGAVAWSASFQIKLDALEKATQYGVSSSQKENREIAIAIRPDFFCHYVDNRVAFHDFGKSSRDLELLDTFASDLASLQNDALIDSLPTARRKEIRLVRRAIRDFNFRWRVLNAYGNKCAFCDIQLGLVEAAHIVPVNYEYSTDETRNGLALCSLHHSAFDAGLVTMNEKYRVILSDEKIGMLRARKLDSGEKLFRESLRRVISVPPTQIDRPAVEYVKRANSIRGW